MVVIAVSQCVIFAQENAPPTSNRSTRYDETLATKLLYLSGAAYGAKQKECIESTFPIEEERFLFTTTEKVCDVLDSPEPEFQGQLLAEGWDTYGVGSDFIGMGKVNRYFMRAQDQLWRAVLEFLARYDYRNHTVIFTGHSLGGAMAALAAARTVKQGYRPSSAVKLYTFGQPRTGSFEFAQNFDALGIESYRVVYASDIVPHQPFCRKDMQMPANKDGSRACRASKDDEAYHHGVEIWYPESMKPGSLYLECLGEPKNEDMDCSDSLTFDVFLDKLNWTLDTPSNVDAFIWDHRHYFDVMASGFGASGCSDRLIGAEPAQQSRISKVISDVFGVLGKLG
ncbi:hypothetical protein PENTCL1PPCAC_15357 [Pristionchus entomophagus]|uniref:Fungal lipase-type domain-containing protein n=1 Tax=Pristionchus entomophagus TaxID=358040 RepID=A0AAV5TEW6_9BILA|nr:hypothetical protein PENTCL1PPCAC_15357 [Pristionchus entomophagus]